MSRVVVTGSRDLWNHDIVWWALNKARKYYGQPIVIHGGCPTGADQFAQEWAEVQGLEFEVFEADWKQFGPPAGPIRNQAMVSAGADLCLAFPLGTSIGTWDCLNKAKRAGIRTIVFKNGDKLL